MKILSFEDITSFEQRVLDFLIQREAENCLLLGVMSRIKNCSSQGDEKPFLAIVESAGKVIGVAVRSDSNRPMIISIMPKEAIDPLSSYVAKNIGSLTGVVGAAAESEMLVSSLAKQLKRQKRLHIGMRCFYLDRVQYHGKASGSLRLAEQKNQNIIASWIKAFTIEALKDNNPKGCEESAKHGIEKKEIFIWEDQRPVTMTMTTGHTPHGIRINNVYTPMELRNRGYATSCVASISQRCLDEGKKFCFLFTDVLNPTSNSIYQKIGYKPICDFSNFILE